MAELTIDQVLQKGIEAHKAGQLQEAERLYTAILKAQQKHPDANHNMGVLAVDVGKVQEALPFFKAALEANPSTAQFWLSYIDTLVKVDQLADAKAVLAQAKSKGAKGDEFDQLEQRLSVLDEEPHETSNATLDTSQEKPNILDSLKLDQAIKLAKKKTKEGSSEEAKRIYQDILTKFSKNKRAVDGLKALSGGANGNKSKVQNPLQAQLQSLKNLYNQGQLSKVVEHAQVLTKQYPEEFAIWNIMGASAAQIGQLDQAIIAFQKVIAIKPDYADAYNNMGNALKEQGKQAEAIEAYKKALAIKPEYAEAYNNMGVALKEQGKQAEAIEAYKKALAIKPEYAEAYNNMGVSLKEQDKQAEAIEAYKKALAIKPEYAEAYNHMGVALQEHGKLEEAIEAYKKTLAIKPDHAGAYNNMGNVLIEQGKLEEAIEAYNKALAIKPDYAEAKDNLATLLKIYSPQKTYADQLIDVNYKIKAKHYENALPKTDQELAIYTLDLLNEVQNADKNICTENLQIYRRNKVDLNCKRHMEIFTKKKIIPNFCFGCFKVQVEVTTVLDLIRLAALFYKIEFESDLTRKCLIEVRPNIPGFYKGLVYCRGIDQANSVKEQLNYQIKDISKNLIAKIKKGCSEFPLIFPQYSEVGTSEKDMMQYPQEWQALENEFDEEALIKPKICVISSLKEFCLSDYLIIQKWIDYSKGINDPTSELFSNLPIKYHKILEIAKTRVRQ
jgi:tetratricopeptide (TPR) repeat protein